jgi:enamine deaminase RidA (YjgF/YER057c/UK114 family)
MDTHPAQLTIAAQGSLDALGLLVHEDDPAAQLALALVNVAGVLRAAGLDWTDLADLRVCTTDLPGLLGVYDTLTEHLESVGAAPRTTVVEVPALPVPGMTVALDGHAVRRTPSVSDSPLTDGNNHDQ